jgi:ABC-type hemin transport system substrate-binding protein
MKVVSLVPSMTETLLAWGIEPVACTRFCEQPGIRPVGGTKDPDVAAITAMRPDLVIVDAEENRREDHDALVAAGVPVHVLEIRSLGDVTRQLRRLAQRLGVGAEVEAFPEAAAVTRTAFVPIWRRPWMALGAPTYGASVLAALGIGVGYGEAYPEVALEAVRADLVIAPSEPYPFRQRHQAELAAVAPVVFVEGKDLFWWGARTAGALERLRPQLP